MLNFTQLKQQFLQDIDSLESLENLEDLRLFYMGKKGLIKKLFHEILAAPPKERKELTQKFNEFKKYVEEVFLQSFEIIRKKEIGKKINEEWVDLSLPGIALERGSLHPLTHIQRKCLEVLSLLGFQFSDGPEVETPYHNFDALNIPEHHPARDQQDTFWLEKGLLLRSHTSTVQIRKLKEEKILPIKIVSPGRVYRNETVDASHLACFHQFEALWVDKEVKFSHLKGTIDFLIKHIFHEEWEHRFKPKFYPYTEPSIGVDIRKKGENTEWLTILGAGMIHPNVFRHTGHDPNHISGFAFGLGISRMATLAHGVTNMKSLYESDLRVHQALSRKEYM